MGILLVLLGFIIGSAYSPDGGGVVGVVGGKLPVVIGNHGIGRTDLFCQRLDAPIIRPDVVQGALLVRDCHAEAAEVQPFALECIAHERVEFLLPALDQ